ncbi:MAG: GtrA family protein [Oscillospiraceae bacterium]|nr:GtrA family protein [Oscillospiraceae bacterium]
MSLQSSKIIEFIKSDTAKKFIKFAITGCINTLVDIGASAAVRAISHNNYIAQIAGYGCGIICSYIINRNWAFRNEKEKFFSSQLVKFLLVNILTCLLSLLFTWIFSTKLNIQPWILMKLMIVGVTIVVNFTLSNLWAFKKKQ